ncbi:hypothetical protein LTR50_007414 [Elasticomyces elasticus]|nr:hypothetical protein LTR50_007414 [Elasticomyces elasticus]
MHVHLCIRFADGSVWLARILPHNVTSFSDELSNSTLRSECATLRWLDMVGVPAPRLHGYGFRNDPRNDVRIAYMLIHELPGKPLSQLEPCEPQMRTAYAGLTSILCTLSEHTFDQIGSLTFAPDGGTQIGPITGDRAGTLSQIGPFQEVTQYYITWAEEYLRMIAARQLFIHYPVDAYLIFKYLDTLAQEGRYNNFERGLDNGLLYLKHMDNKGDHILVDDNFNITGIIDWSFARTVPAYEAFGPSLVTADMDDVLNGRARLSEQDKLLGQALQAEKSSLAPFAQSVDQVRRFTFALGMGMNLSWDEALDVFKGIIATLDDKAWEKAINDEVAELVAHLGADAIMGCANYHAHLFFDDGEEWLIRIPRTGFSDVPAELVEYLVASEYATLKFLESTQVPAPKAFGFGLASDSTNRVGVNYLLMQALPGKPYYPHEATVEQKSYLLGRLADMLIEISKYPLPKARSLFLTDGKIDVSAVTSNRFVSLGRYGPFDTASDYFISIAEQYLDLISDGQVYHEYPKEAFLFYEVLRQHAIDLSANEVPNVFYMKHVDDKGDHLLVNEDYNITGIIDWQFARSVPMCEAFGPSLMTADLNALYSSEAGVTDDDKRLARVLRVRGREDLAGNADRSELVQRFHHGLANGLTRDEVLGMIKGLLAILGVERIDDMDELIAEESIKCQSDHRWNTIDALSRGESWACSLWFEACYCCCLSA